MKKYRITFTFEADSEEDARTKAREAIALAKEHGGFDGQIEVTDEQGQQVTVNE